MQLKASTLALLALSGRAGAGEVRIWPTSPPSPPPLRAGCRATSPGGSPPPSLRHAPAMVSLYFTCSEQPGGLRAAEQVNVPVVLSEQQ